MQQYAMIHGFTCDSNTCEFINGCDYAAMRPTCEIAALRHASSLCLHECHSDWLLLGGIQSHCTSRSQHGVERIYVQSKIA